MSKLLFVINPISGDIDKEDLEEDIRAFCRRNNLEMVVYQTTGQEDEKHLKEKITSCNPDAVVAAGGDGTVSLAAKSIIHTSIPLGILPLGSGNGLSKDLGIPQDFDEALHLLAEHEVRPIDTLEINGHLSIHLCDMGFNALVVERFCQGETRGPGAYAWIAMQEYINYEPKTYTIEAEGKTIFSGEAFMIIVTNAKAFGSNATINPSGVMDDGIFEICVLEPFPKASGLGILYQLYTDSIDDSVYTHRFSVRSAVIKNHSQEYTQIDGEPVALREDITCNILPRSLHVILPQKEN